MAIPGIVGTGGGGRVGSGAFTVTLPGGASGYVAIANWRGSTGSLTPPAGWTALDTGQGTDEYATWGVWIGTASAGTSWTQATGGGTHATAVVTVGYDGPVDVDVWGDANSMVSPTVTTTEEALVLRAVAAQNFDGTYSGVTYPAGSPDGQAVHTEVDGERWTAAVAHADDTTPGATGTATWAIPGVSLWSPQAFTIALTTEGGGPVLHAIAATIAAASTVAADVHARLALGATTPATAGQAADLGARLGLAATVEATTQTAADLGVAPKDLSATVTATSDQSAAIGARLGVAATAEAATDIAAAITTVAYLEATVAATSSTSADIGVSEAGSLDLGATVPVTSTTAADIGAHVGIEATVTATAQTTATLGATHTLTATVAAETSTSATLSVPVPIAATVSAITTVAAAIDAYDPSDGDDTLTIGRGPYGSSIDVGEPYGHPMDASTPRGHQLAVSTPRR
ncbi:hypothetical protein [Isoptericola aurantiacus]|uniref:hypothetical protein n=1 Tax=Isoptericola aurantiacus TaxID=3377839 RepID=UPI00383AC446